VDRIPSPIQRKLRNIPVKEMIPTGRGYDYFEKRIFEIFIRRRKRSKKHIMGLTD